MWSIHHLICLYVILQPVAGHTIGTFVGLFAWKGVMSNPSPLSEWSFLRCLRISFVVAKCLAQFPISQATTSFLVPTDFTCVFTFIEYSSSTFDGFLIRSSIPLTHSLSRSSLSARIQSLEYVFLLRVMNSSSCSFLRLSQSFAVLTASSILISDQWNCKSLCNERVISVLTESMKKRRIRLFALNETQH